MIQVLGPTRSRQGAVADTRPDAGNCSRLFEVYGQLWHRQPLDVALRGPAWREQSRKESVGEAEAKRQERLS